MKPYSWTCPVCQRPATLSEHDVSQGHHDLHVVHADGPWRLISVFLVCPNPECNKATLVVKLHSLKAGQLGTMVMGDEIRHWSLIPSSSAKSYPDYVPQTIRDDYEEACVIADLSPKAAATLARRCLQGILRDFWHVKPGRLVDEIDQIKDKVDPLTWDAIETVRRVGNVGAHMERDINLIIEVEPGEARLLIELIETLIRDWYIAREERKRRLEQIAALGKKKLQVGTEATSVTTVRAKRPAPGKPGTGNALDAGTRPATGRPG